MTNKCDVLVIGGGVIGTSVAYSLCKRNYSVMLLERSELASGTAGATDGYITYHTKKPGIHLDMGIQSGGMFDQLAYELHDAAGIDIEYEKNCGSIQVVDREEDYPYIASMVKEQHEQTRLDVAMYSIDELRKIEPALSPSLIGGLYCPTAGKVNPMKLVFAFAAAAKNLTCKIMENTEVTDLIIQNGRAIGVHTTAGSYYADYIVNAAGTWAGNLAKMAGLNIPIKPRRGQILVTETLAPIIKTTMQCARTTAIKLNPKMLETLPEKIIRMGTGFCIEQTADGTLLLGFTREFSGFDRDVTLEAIDYIAARAVKFIPALEDVNFIRSFSGLRPYTPDGLPVIGKVDEIEGFIMAAGHEGDGICLAPLTGEMVAEIISDTELSFPVENFSYKRFA
jgi:glycine/D-amino acid oxidase-like deaminating enzyme